MDSGNKIIGIDIGGTKVHIGLVQDGIIVKDVKLSTSAQAPKEQIIKEILSGVAEIITPDVQGIGVGVPGLVDEKNGIVHNVLNIPAWEEVHLRMHLEDFFRKPICITNDANSFAAGEKIFGKAKKYRNIVGVTLGTGFGSGIIIDNNLYSGSFASAGEFGGMPYLDQTLEDYCSGKFFENKSGISGKMLKALAENGDTDALSMFDQYGHHLGNAIKMILYALSPEAIFLGGSISSCFPFFKETMFENLSGFPFKQVIEKLVIERSELENAAVLGAAAIFKMRNASSYANTITFV